MQECSRQLQKNIDRSAISPRLTEESRGNVERSYTTTVQACQSEKHLKRMPKVLGDLESLVLKYQGLAPQAKRTWDRIKWSDDGVVDLRVRLISTVTVLSAFMRYALCCSPFKSLSSHVPLLIMPSFIQHLPNRDRVSIPHLYAELSSGPLRRISCVDNNRSNSARREQGNMGNSWAGM